MESYSFGFIGQFIQEEVVWGGDVCQCTRLTCQMTSFFYVFPAISEHLLTLSMKTHVLLAGHRQAQRKKSVLGTFNHLNEIWHPSWDFPLITLPQQILLKASSFKKKKLITNAPFLDILFETGIQFRISNLVSLFLCFNCIVTLTAHVSTKTKTKRRLIYRFHIQKQPNLVGIYVSAHIC